MPCTTDFNKRHTLKTLSAATAAVMTPSLASAVCKTSDDTSNADPMAKGLQLTFEGVSKTGRQKIRLRNNTDEAITLKHISPGLVKSEGSMFDINALLADGPITLQAGETRSMFTAPVARNASEKSVPAGIIQPGGVTVSSRYDAWPVVNKLRTVQTRRMLLS